MARRIQISIVEMARAKQGTFAPLRRRFLSCDKTFEKCSPRVIPAGNPGREPRQGTPAHAGHAGHAGC